MPKTQSNYSECQFSIHSSVLDSLYPINILHYYCACHVDDDILKASPGASLIQWKMNAVNCILYHIYYIFNINS